MATARPPTQNQMATRPKGRTLILCFDGTSEKFAVHNSNVVKLFQMLVKGDAEQHLYYQPGIGTYVTPSFITPAVRTVAEVADDAFAWYLDGHVMGGYAYLQRTYQENDRICVFGFSRGAYTARALAGMLVKVGLLPRGNIEQIPFAWELYCNTGEANADLSRHFKDSFCKDVTVEFVGVWDTVSSVGLLYSPNLPFVESNDGIKYFRHAVALDEHRAKFDQNLYHAPRDPCIKDLTDVQEVWFAGCHEDVGGGILPDTVESALSNVSLNWMVQKIEEANIGVKFIPEKLDALKAKFKNEYSKSPVNANIIAPVHDSMSNYSSMLNIGISIFWNCIELLPFRRIWRSPETSEMYTTFQPHLGRGRYVPSGATLHESVKIRMESGLGYKPRALVPADVRFVK